MNDLETGGAALALGGPMGLEAYGLAKKSGMLNAPNVPQQQIANLDPQTQALIQKQQQQAGESTGQISGELTAGTEKGANVLPTATQFNQQATALGMANPQDLGAALSARAARYNQGNQIALTNQANMKAGDIQASREKQALQNEKQVNQIHQQQYDIALNNQLQQRKARGQMVGNLLGIAGMAGGALAGGGAGAGAGMSAGQGLGMAAAGG